LKKGDFTSEEFADHSRNHYRGYGRRPYILLQNTDSLGRFASIPTSFRIADTNTRCCLLTHGKHYECGQGSCQLLRCRFSADIGPTICQDYKGTATRFSTRRPRGDDMPIQHISRGEKRQVFGQALHARHRLTDCHLYL